MTLSVFVFYSYQCISLSVGSGRLSAADKMVLGSGTDMSNLDVLKKAWGFHENQKLFYLKEPWRLNETMVYYKHGI